MGQQVTVALPKLADLLDQVRGTGQRRAVLQLLKHQRQVIVAVHQQFGQLRRVTATSVKQAFVERFQLVTEVAHRPDFGHARAPLEGVQVTLQR